MGDAAERETGLLLHSERLGRIRAAGSCSRNVGADARDSEDASGGREPRDRVGDRTD
jgi:hypothetical protein